MEEDGITIQKAAYMEEVTFFIITVLSYHSDRQNGETHSGFFI